MANGGKPAYVIHASSLLEVLRFDNRRARAILQALVAMVGEGRLRTVSFAWQGVKDDLIAEYFKPCLDSFVIDELELEDEIGHVLAVCGNAIVGNDPYENDPDPWLAAAAKRLGSIVICERSPLVRLPEACGRLRIQCDSLRDMIEAEGI